MSLWLERLLILLALVGAAAFLSAADAAVIAARRSRLRELADGGNAVARRVLRLLEDPARLSAAAQVAVAVLWVLVAAVTVVSYLPPLRHALMVAGLSAFWAFFAGLILLTLILASILTIIVEMVPRTIATASAERFALLGAPPLHLVSLVLAPVIAAVAAVGNLIVRPLGVTCRLGAPVRSEEELKMLVEAVEDEGAIEEDEREMIDSIFEFSDTLVRQVMVPRVDMHTSEIDATLDDLVDLVLQHGHSRIPVYQGTIDTIVGVVHAKDLLRSLRQPEASAPDASEIMRPAMFVPENKMVSDLLQDFQEQKQQMAIVRDEYGGTAGLVTVEDLLEEIVGEIQDEYDQEEPMVTKGDDGQLLVQARMSISDLNEDLDLGLPEGDYETVGGFVFGLHGTEPAVGDAVRYNGFVLTVMEKDGRRLSRILIEASPEATSEEDGVDQGAQLAEPGSSGDG